MRKLAQLALSAVGLTACGQAEDPPAPAPVHDDSAVEQTAAGAQHHERKRRGLRFLVARVREGRTVAVRREPNGPVLTRIDARTEFGMPRVLGIVRRSGRWLAASLPQLGNRRLGWIEKSRALRFDAVRTWIKADLSRRRVELRRGNRIVESARVGIGRPGAPTPTGRFGVTDKLPGGRFSAYYGRAIVALSGRQPRTPPGWRGGDRLAIHGTNAPGRVGERTSAGCLVATDPAIGEIAQKVPLGAPVVIEQ